ncbi:FadR/GntR family transcriptional regulator [Arthrobacter sp. M4]|uniref:FadR/GntR family transcriptional regulator n=1 Tax=Arthrobacter sp. M4 TaxID=218160 RepID=UPI001CDCFDE1|nr:FadR/GntR family transcriptional regulator [Arthrobacter sp. M4]MCA4133203.1 FadR family transcriptional regulator [Arthrobacter sp. M4]
MSKNLTVAVADRLRAQIVDGEIQPGEKLPSENTLISKFSVSRTVVRAAITRLQAEGLVETERGRGSFALTPPPDAGARTQTGRPVVSLEDRLNLLEFRIGVESEAAALAARNHSDRQLSAMSTALDGFAGSGGHPSTAMKYDFEFHRAIAEASANPFFADCIAGLGQTMIAMPRTRLMPGGEPYAPEQFERVVQEHTSIYAAIVERDSAAAASAMRTHLGNSRRRLRAAARAD